MKKLVTILVETNEEINEEKLYRMQRLIYSVSPTAKVSVYAPTSKITLDLTSENTFSTSVCNSLTEKDIVAAYNSLKNDSPHNSYLDPQFDNVKPNQPDLNGDTYVPSAAEYINRKLSEYMLTEEENEIARNGLTEYLMRWDWCKDADIKE